MTCRRSRRVGAALVAAAVGVPCVVGAQGTAVVAVHLGLHPTVGDTLRTRFEQSLTVTPQGAKVAAVASTLLVLARTMVERADAAGCEVVALTDSVAMSATGIPAPHVEKARRALARGRVRLHVTPAGAMTLLVADPGRAGAAAARVAPVQLPATLPGTAVAPGARWVRHLPVPWGGDAGTRLEVTFRLDSVGRGRRAFLSMVGAVRGAAAQALGGPRVTGGTVRGVMVVDLARGWVMESRTTFLLDGTVPGGFAGGAVGGDGTPATAPVRVVVEQRLRTL